MHTQSVSLNKIGDLKYYGGELQSARSYYTRALNIRRNAVKQHADASSQVKQLVLSLVCFIHYFFFQYFLLLQSPKCMIGSLQDSI